MEGLRAEGKGPGEKRQSRPALPAICKEGKWCQMTGGEMVPNDLRTRTWRPQTVSSPPSPPGSLCSPDGEPRAPEASWPLRQSLSSVSLYGVNIPGLCGWGQLAGVPGFSPPSQQLPASPSQAKLLHLSTNSQAPQTALRPVLPLLLKTCWASGSSPFWGLSFPSVSMGDDRSSSGFLGPDESPGCLRLSGHPASGRQQAGPLRSSGSPAG